MCKCVKNNTVSHDRAGREGREKKRGKKGEREKRCASRRGRGWQGDGRSSGVWGGRYGGKRGEKGVCKG